MFGSNLDQGNNMEKFNKFVEGTLNEADIDKEVKKLSKKIGKVMTPKKPTTYHGGYAFNTGTEFEINSVVPDGNYIALTFTPLDDNKKKETITLKFINYNQWFRDWKIIAK